MHAPDELPAASPPSGWLRLDEAAAARLARYREALAREARTRNLSGAGADPERIRRQLEEPSCALGLVFRGGDAPARAIDLGSGNGYPGVVVAAAWPAAPVLLVERRQRKAEAIRRCLDAAGFPNARVCAADARDLVAHEADLRGAMDLVTARGVGALGLVNRLAAPFLAPGGRVVHWKASDLGDTERTEGDRVARALGLGARREWTPCPGPPGPGRLVVYARPATGDGGARP